MDHLQPASFVLAILMATTAFVLAAAWLLNKAAFSLLFRTDSTKEMLATGQGTIGPAQPQFGGISFTLRIASPDELRALLRQGISYANRLLHRGRGWRYRPLRPVVPSDVGEHIRAVSGVARPAEICLCRG